MQARRIEFIIKTQYEFENASQMDVGQAEVDVMDSEATLIEMEGNLRSSIERLDLALGIPLETDIKLSDQIETTPLPLKSSEYITLVTETNLSLKDTLVSIQKAENSLKVAKLGLQPDVYLSGSYSDANKGTHDMTGALIFNWMFGDGGATKARVEALQKQIEQQKVQLWNQERSLVTEAFNDLRRLDLLNRQIEIQKKNVDKAYINMQNALYNFQNFGKISFRDMQQFQLDLSRSRFEPDSG